MISFSFEEFMDHGFLGSFLNNLTQAVQETL